MQEVLNYSLVNTVNGQMGYSKIGQGRPLVMLTRYAATLANWDSGFVFTLAKHFTLYLFDHIGIGNSSFKDVKTVNEYALCVAEVVEALQLKQPLFLGWSFGCGILQGLNLYYASNVAGMVFISGVPDAKAVDAEFSRLTKATFALLTPKEKTQLNTIMFGQLPNKDFFINLKKSKLQILNYIYNIPEATKFLHNDMIDTWPGSSFSQLEQIQVPTLILRAKDDFSIPLNSTITFLRHIPNSKLIAYPDGGHLLIHHHGIAAAKDIIAYFKNVMGEL